MMCCVEKKISKLKFLNYDFRQCNIHKLVVTRETFFDVLNQSKLYQGSIDTHVDILKSFYLYVINSGIDTSKNIKEKSPITYNGESCFEIDTNIINNTIIIREIATVCERNNIKLWIEIKSGTHCLIYKDE